MYLYILNCSFSLLNNSNCLRQIIKKAELCQISPKIGTLPLFLRVLGIFLLNTWLETGTSYACAKSISKIQMFILIHFTNLVTQNAAKQRMTKCHPQKSLSNNARSVRVSPLKILEFVWSVEMEATKKILSPFKPKYQHAYSPHCCPYISYGNS